MMKTIAVATLNVFVNIKTSFQVRNKLRYLPKQIYTHYLPIKQ